MNFSTSLVRSAFSFIPDETINTTSALFDIAVTDFLSAALAFSFNDHLQESLSQYREDLPEEACVYRNGVVLVAGAMNIVLLSFSAHGIVRGSARASMLNHQVMPFRFHDEYANEQLLQTNRREREARRATLEQELGFIGARSIDEGIDLCLPNNYSEQLPSKLLKRQAIVGDAPNWGGLCLRHRRANSLFFIVGRTYFLGTNMRDLTSEGGNNPYLNLSINRCVLFSLLAIMESLRLRNVNLTSVMDKNLKRSRLYLDPFSLRRNRKFETPLRRLLRPNGSRLIWFLIHTFIYRENPRV